MSDMTENKSVVEWGPEIAVDGKRPEWLGDGDIVLLASGWSNSGEWGRASWIWNWYAGEAIRLPADHPHYHPAPVVTALAERMEALVRKVAASRYGADMHVNDFAEARAIVAEMTPVDADLVEARKMVFQENPLSEQVMTGAWDNLPAVHYALSGIKRGRELERGE